MPVGIVHGADVHHNVTLIQNVLVAGSEITTEHFKIIRWKLGTFEVF